MPYLAEVAEAIKDLMRDQFGSRIFAESRGADMAILFWTPATGGPVVRMTVEWYQGIWTGQAPQANPEERAAVERAGYLRGSGEPSRMGTFTPSTDSDWATRDFPRHTVSEVARYTGLSQSTIRRWLKLAGRTAPFEASHLDLMELAVVAALLGAGRTWGAIRLLHAALVDAYSTPHPFADARLAAPLIDVILPTEIVERVMPTLGALRFNLPALDYSDDLAVRWYPRGRANPAVIDARYGFGSPTVGGVNTWALAGRARGGEDVDLIAEEYDLTVEQVRAAVEFEGAEEAES